MGRKGKGKSDFADLPDPDEEHEGNLEAPATEEAPVAKGAPSKKKEKKGKGKKGKGGFDSDEDDDSVKPSAVPAADSDDDIPVAKTKAAAKKKKGGASGFAALAVSEDEDEEPAVVSKPTGKGASSPKKGAKGKQAFAALAGSEDDEDEEDDEPAKPQLVIAEVLSVDPHPKADKLKVCEVDTGTATYKVITNVMNTREGMHVVFAPVGMTTPGSNLKIEKRNLKGVDSFGMLCSAYDIGWVDKPDNQLVVLSADDFQPGEPCPTKPPKVADQVPHLPKLEDKSKRRSGPGVSPKALGHSGIRESTEAGYGKPGTMSLRKSSSNNMSDMDSNLMYPSGSDSATSFTLGYVPPSVAALKKSNSIRKAYGATHVGRGGPVATKGKPGLLSNGSNGADQQGLFTTGLANLSQRLQQIASQAAASAEGNGEVSGVAEHYPKMKGTLDILFDMVSSQLDDGVNTKPGSRSATGGSILHDCWGHIASYLQTSLSTGTNATDQLARAQMAAKKAEERLRSSQREVANLMLQLDSIRAEKTKVEDACKELWDLNNPKVCDILEAAHFSWLPATRQPIVVNTIKVATLPSGVTSSLADLPIKVDLTTIAPSERILERQSSSKRHRSASPPQSLSADTPQALEPTMPQATTIEPLPEIKPSRPGSGQTGMRRASLLRPLPENDALPLDQLRTSTGLDDKEQPRCSAAQDLLNHSSAPRLGSSYGSRNESLNTRHQEGDSSVKNSSSSGSAAGAQADFLDLANLNRELEALKHHSAPELLEPSPAARALAAARSGSQVQHASNSGLSSASGASSASGDRANYDVVSVPHQDDIEPGGSYECWGSAATNDVQDFADDGLSPFHSASSSFTDGSGSGLLGLVTSPGAPSPPVPAARSLAAMTVLSSGSGSGYGSGSGSGLRRAVSPEEALPVRPRSRSPSGADGAEAPHIDVSGAGAASPFFGVGSGSGAASPFFSGSSSGGAASPFYSGSSGGGAEAGGEGGSSGSGGWGPRPPSQGGVGPSPGGPAPPLRPRSGGSRAGSARMRPGSGRLSNLSRMPEEGSAFADADIVTGLAAAMPAQSPDIFLRKTTLGMYADRRRRMSSYTGIDYDDPPPSDPGEGLERLFSGKAAAARSEIPAHLRETQSLPATMLETAAAEVACTQSAPEEFHDAQEERTVEQMTLGSFDSWVERDGSQAGSKAGSASGEPPREYAPEYITNMR